MKDHLSNTYNINAIYHFTDKRNLPAIRRAGGLLPRRSLGQDPYFPGGNQWSIEADNMFGLDQHVHCCFLSEHPMEYLARTEGRIDPVWLRISTAILRDPRVRYTPGVSNQRGIPQYNNQEAIDSLDLFPLYGYIDWKVPEELARRKNAEKFEILIPFLIPVDFIGGL